MENLIRFFYKYKNRRFLKSKIAPFLSRYSIIDSFSAFALNFTLSILSYFVLSKNVLYRVQLDDCWRKPSVRNENKNFIN